jgi:hypothetical protein
MIRSLDDPRRIPPASGAQGRDHAAQDERLVQQSPERSQQFLERYGLARSLLLSSPIERSRIDVQ